jgi:hypothetical protein
MKIIIMEKTIVSYDMGPDPGMAIWYCFNIALLILLIYFIYRVLKIFSKLEKFLDSRNEKKD